MLKHYLGDQRIAISILMVLLALGIGYWWFFGRPDAETGVVEAQIIAFEVKNFNKVRNPITLGRVRLLSETKERFVSWPEGRAVNCNPGDVVRLEQSEKGLRLLDQTCRRR